MYETIFVGLYFGAFGAFGGLVAQWDVIRCANKIATLRWGDSDWRWGPLRSYTFRALKAGIGTGSLAIAANHAATWAARLP